MGKHMKLILLTVCLFVLKGISNVSAQSLVLHHANGTTTDVELYTMPQVKFQDDKVLITSTVLDMEFSKFDVLKFTYKGGASGITSPSVNASYTQEDGRIVFHGINATDKLAVYAVNGIRVPVNFQRSGSYASLPLASIPSGVYVLSINGRTSKFTKR